MVVCFARARSGESDVRTFAGKLKTGTFHGFYCVVGKIVGGNMDAPAYVSAQYDQASLLRPHGVAGWPGLVRRETNRSHIIFDNLTQQKEIPVMI